MIDSRYKINIHQKDTGEDDHTKLHKNKSKIISTHNLKKIKSPTTKHPKYDLLTKKKSPNKERY